MSTTYEEKLEAIKRSGHYTTIAGNLVVQEGRVLLPNNTFIDYEIFRSEIFLPIAKKVFPTIDNQTNNML